MLEQFWLELSQGFVDLDKVTLPSSSRSLPKFVEDMLESSGYYFYNLLPYSSDQQRNYSSKTKSVREHPIKMKQLKSFYSSAIFGNDRMFKPRWRAETILTDPDYFAPQKWTYMYDF
jgi:NTE family protein